jgi:hypothetical protein
VRSVGSGFPLGVRRALGGEYRFGLRDGVIGRVDLAVGGVVGLCHVDHS